MPMAEDDRRRNHSELALRAAEIGTWDYDLVADICHFDRQAQLLYGLTSDTLDHRPEGVAAVVHPDDVAPMFDAVQRAADVHGDGRYDIDYRIARGDGTYRWLSAWGEAQFEGDGAARHAVRIVGASRDVTSVKEAQQRLADSEERFARFAASSSDALWIRDARSYAFEYVSPAIEAIYGVTPQAVLADAETINDLILPEQRKHISANVERIARGEVIVHEYQIRRATDGAIRWIRSTGFPLLGKDGQVSRIGAIAQDITDHKLADSALRASEERQAFLLRLSDALRPLGSAREVRQVASRLLGETLGASRAYYVEYDQEKQFGLVGEDYAADGLPSLAGRYPYEAFRTTYERVQHGGTWTVADVAAAEEIALAERSYYQQQGVIAWCNVPLLKDGSLRAVLCVVQASPREWSSADIELIENVAERTWAALERARAETALRQSEEELRIALEAGRLGTYRLNLNTGEQSWSDRQYEIFGLTRGNHTPTRELFLSLVHPDDHYRIEFTLDDIRRPGTFLDSEFRITRPDGALRWITAHALALFDDQGRPAELIGVNHDVTEQRRLEAAMQSSEELLREFSEASSDVMWIRRASDLQWIFLSPAFHKIYGISRQDALRGDNYFSWTNLIVPDDREMALANIEAVRKGERRTFEYRVRRPEDGAIRWLRNTDFPMRDETGEVVRIGGIGHDITPLKEADEHQRMLTAELQHRVRNTLAVIRSIARRTASTSGSVDDFAMNLEGRIDAFARVQSVVTRDPTGGVDLAMLVAEELRAASAREDRGLSMNGPDLRLRAKPAETLALGIHELATNAIKHGALLHEGGQIDIDWQVTDDRLIFRWKESGVPIDGPPTRQGLGTEILSRTLPYDLGATARLELEPDGLRYEVSLPVTVLIGRA